MSIMQNKRFRMNCGSGYGVMKSNGMNGMFGIKNHTPRPDRTGLSGRKELITGPEDAVLSA